MGTSPDTLLTSPLPSAVSTLDLLDAAARDRVLVYGSLPPAGRDFDLLGRPDELVAIREALVAAGFIERRGVFVRFHLGSVEAVELTPAESWRLPPDDLEALFAEAQPIAGTRHLVQPSPHHALLIRARKTARQRKPSAQVRARVNEALASDPDAWEGAQQRASVWKARYALALLRTACGSTGRVSALIRWRAFAEHLSGSGAPPVQAQLRALRALLPRLRRTHVVAFSGLDGAGKTSQAAVLREALSATGQDAVVVWKGIGRNRILWWLKAPVQTCLRALPGGGSPGALVDRVLPDLSGRNGLPGGSPGTPERRPRGIWLSVVTQLWATLVAVVNVLAVRRSTLRAFGRGRIIIYDRYTLDSAVKLLYWYGDTWMIRLLIRLIHHATPTPLKSYFLDVPAQVAFERKGEWGLDDLAARATLYSGEYKRLRVRRLDATRPTSELSEEIATEVWASLPS